MDFLKKKMKELMDDDDKKDDKKHGGTISVNRCHCAFADPRNQTLTVAARIMLVTTNDRTQIKVVINNTPHKVTSSKVTRNTATPSSSHSSLTASMDTVHLRRPKALLHLYVSLYLANIAMLASR